MNNRVLPVVLIAGALAAAGAGYYFLWPATSVPPPGPPRAEAARIQHPIGVPADAALPPLAESDDALAAAIAALAHSPSLPEIFYPDRIVRRWVATIDNLPREQVAPEVRALKPADGPLVTQGEDATLAIGAANAARYARYLDLLRSIDVADAATLYRRFYPLFQAAYEDLGYPGKYFNDRLVAVIDHLLETPDPQPPLRLIRPSVMFRYADPKLERLSAGQKAMLRIGRDHAAVVREKLRALRAELVRGG